jgi:hypothetical protein
MSQSSSVNAPASGGSPTRGGTGSALALRNWRVPWRLIALIAIPTVVAMAFAGLRVGARQVAPPPLGVPSSLGCSASR